ncbi:TetR/AcrR family transcriptional regulator [Leucobacter sp. W1153]|uniref:TetR/AcrR family transcriptional regulator n=1 Tax=Leucobacter sp. W1153 TaxID=3439064 RepID=UPI003F2B92F6
MRRRPGENRIRLIAAATIEFSLLGYRGASTVSIGARAEVPQPHVYASFTNKLELYLAVVERVSASLNAQGLGAHHASSTVSDPTAVSVAQSHEWDSLASAESEVPRVHAAFLLQAVAASADPDVGDASRALIREAQVLIGQESFSACLLDGVEYLLEQ